MKLTDEKPKETVPFYKQRNRAKTPHAEAVKCMERGWSWNGRKYACRDDWEAAVLGYDGIFTI